LSSVNEIGEVIAESVYSFFHGKAGGELIADLKKVGLDPKMAKPAASATGSLPLAGKTIVVTGTMVKMDRNEIEALILKLGAKPPAASARKPPTSSPATRRGANSIRRKSSASK
jgi:DNA ligase (NAD+)